MSAPVSPPARRRRLPSWLDLRVVLGVVLVVGSVVAGARLFAVADRTVQVWAVARDLGVGTVLVSNDLVAVRVRLPENAARYLAANGPEPVGRRLARDVGAGELLPRAALIDRVCGSEVSIPVSTQHVPATVRRGARVDVFATPRGGETTRVLAAVTVQSTVRGSAVGGGSALVVRVADELTADVVRAVRTADIDVVVVTGRAAGDGCGAPPSAGAPSAGVPSAGAPSGGVPSAGAPSGGLPSDAAPSGEPPSDGAPSAGADGTGLPATPPAPTDEGAGTGGSDESGGGDEGARSDGGDGAGRGGGEVERAASLGRWGADR
ncbi:SAF domain-containing protein [Cryptosporangium aurantiacum]|uniref:SAF domain-containing protein n=1 Tax=Cryptosporangium aurantiacum TaxID=134849 RepID=A0A1M7RNT7_9ACTN|nr:SAF domain-containing protein [Cryptosporangium aurantiacum]SHN47810.1 SAF domain-containing protein [Cryptosporangium aurantiacum]